MRLCKLTFVGHITAICMHFYLSFCKVASSLGSLALWSRDLTNVIQTMRYIDFQVDLSTWKQSYKHLKASKKFHGFFDRESPNFTTGCYARTNVLQKHLCSRFSRWIGTQKMIVFSLHVCFHNHFMCTDGRYFVQTKPS